MPRFFLRFSLLAMMLCLPAVGAMAASSESVRGIHSSAQLHTEYEQVPVSKPFYALLHLKMDPEWHSYWSNPGDSGLPTRIEWELPEGWTAGDILWQPPVRLPYGPLVNYGYDANSYHLVKITPAPDAQNGQTVALSAHANWLVCKEECVPETADLTVVVGLGEAMPSDTYELIERLYASADIPQVAGVAQRAKAGGAFTLEVPLEGAESIKEAYFFVEETGSVEPSAPQKLAVAGDKLQLSLQEGAVALPKETGGILELHDAAGEVSHRQVNVTQGAVAALPEAPAAPVVAAGDATPLLLTLVFAFIGGFILNAMPCVFPVLSLKALGLSKKSAKERGQVRAHGYSYTAGVVLSFALVGAVLIALKTAGGAIGWGYQMQSPYFVAGLTYLLFVIGLNLAGYFEVTFHMSVGTQTGEKETLKGSFAMGALVTLVATPCTAPFMATALGAALSQPPAVGMAIFLSMGLGLAFPYLLLTTIPGALKWMPKPGAWMERFKQFLAFPMFISAIWLVWVFSLQAGPNATALLLLGLVALTMAIWLGRAITPKGAVGRYLLGLALLGLVALPLLGLPKSIAVPSQNTQEIDGAVTRLAYDEATLASLREEGKPVFLYATAAWCITCKVNERAALGDAKVQEFLTEQGINVMVADWTNEDARITRLLEQFGRAGVPLYIFYPAGGGAPKVLPQLLTPATVIEELS